MDDATVSPTPPDKHSEEPIDAGSPSTTLDTLQYDRITQDRHIRVLDLAPGSWDEPVICSLRDVHLDDDDLRYEAISYAWGDANDRKTVICNGHVVSTTRSLFEALQRFRYTGTTRTLWADALCINQADNEERTVQVRLMSFIYTKAVRVLVWLKHEDDQVVHDSLNAICRYVLRSDEFAHDPQVLKHHQNPQMLYKWRGVTVTSVSGDDSLESLDILRTAMNALRLTCSSQWFSRGWVIQEVALEASTSVFWGYAEIGFEWLGIAASGGLISASDICTFNMLNCYLLFELCPLYETSECQQKSWFSLLHATTRVTFSDPKDRIYGLLGLTTTEYDPADGRFLVDPDYSITTMECYRRVASKLLLEWHDLRVLSWGGGRFESTKDWPSWVPDWKGSRICRFGAVTDANWNVSRGSNMTNISETVKNGNHCVAISGFRVDAVGREHKAYRDLGELKNGAPGIERLYSMLSFLENVYSLECLACTFGNRFRFQPLSPVRTTNLLGEYYTFMSSDIWKDILRPVPMLLYGDDEFPSFAPSADRFFDRCRRDRYGHSLFITSTRMLVLGPENMLPGDVAVVLHGSTIPFVLRPTSDGLWRLVGECYVYDVNEGRIHREWEEKGSVSEKFCIY